MVKGLGILLVCSLFYLFGCNSEGVNDVGVTFYWCVYSWNELSLLNRFGYYLAHALSWLTHGEVDLEPPKNPKVLHTTHG